MNTCKECAIVVEDEEKLLGKYTENRLFKRKTKVEDTNTQKSNLLQINLNTFFNNNRNPVPSFPPETFCLINGANV